MPVQEPLRKTAPVALTSAACDVFAPAVSTATQAFRVLPAPAQDPQVISHNGLYFYCESTEQGIFVRSAAHFLDFAQSPRVNVWAPVGFGPASRNIWAPEIHKIDGQFFIYFAADDGRNANHRMWALRSRTDDPLGPYEFVGLLQTGGWAIDGTVLTMNDRERFFVWSGWPGKRNGRQNLYIARMKSPTELVTDRVLLTSPELGWEKHGMPICEAPQILQRAGRTFIVYSASGSWTEHYCLGLLEYLGGDILAPRSWKKTVRPVFAKNRFAGGVGHCGFATAENGAEDWLLYHVKTSPLPGWSDREVRAQPIEWNADGTPLFGSPGPLSASEKNVGASGFDLIKSA